MFGVDCKFARLASQTSKTKLRWAGLWAMSLKWSTHADVKKGRERRSHQTQRRLTKNGEGGSGEADRHTNVHTNAHVHMNGAHKTAEKQTSFIRAPAVHIGERMPLTNAVCNQGCMHCPRQTGTQLAFFADVCANIGHMVVWQLRTMAQQTKQQNSC